jgi:hypothetical protein
VAAIATVLAVPTVLVAVYGMMPVYLLHEARRNRRRDASATAPSAPAGAAAEPASPV